MPMDEIRRVTAAAVKSLESRSVIRRIAQVDSLTPASTIEVGDLFTATINGKTLSYAATNTTIASVTAGFTTAWNASTIPEFAEITAADKRNKSREATKYASQPK